MHAVTASVLPGASDASVGPSRRAAFYAEEHFHGSGLRLADALIAATAINLGLPLLTANTRHYKIFRDLELHRFKA